MIEITCMKLEHCTQSDIERRFTYIFLWAFVELVLFFFIWAKISEFTDFIFMFFISHKKMIFQMRDDDDDDEWEGGPNLYFIQFFGMVGRKNKLNFFLQLYENVNTIKWNSIIILLLLLFVIIFIYDELHEKSFQLERVINELSFFGWSSVNLFKLVFII